MVSAQLVAPVLREQLKSCAPISFELSNCWAAHQSLRYIDPTLTCQRIGLPPEQQVMWEELTSGMLSGASTWGESPKPNAENGGDDKRDPAYAHWNGKGSNRDLGVLEQSQEMTNRKNSKNDARDAQSSFLRVHGVILVGAFWFVSKNTCLGLASPQGRRLHEDADDHKPDEHNGRTGWRKINSALKDNQMGADKGGDNDQCPIEQNEQENRPDNSASQENDGGVLRILNKECSSDRSRKLGARQETENSNRNYLKKQRKQSSN
jgi:hypothetical protein